MSAPSNLVEGAAGAGAGDAVPHALARADNADELVELRQAARRAGFLLEATAALASSLEYEETLSQIAQLAVARVADWCVVEIAAEQGASAPVEIAHVDPTKVELTGELWRRNPANPGVFSGVRAVLGGGGGPRLWAQITDEQLRAEASDAAHLDLLRGVGLRSAMIVPMIARGRTLGAITLVCGQSERRYGARDLEMAEDLGRRAAIAVDTARLHLTSREAVRAREDLLAIVAHDLRNPLAGVLMRCSLLLETLPEDEAGASVRRDVQAMRRSARRMEALLRDLLDFGKIQAGGLRVERQTQPVSGLLAEVLEEVPPLAGKRTITVDTERVDPTVEVRCDRERFLQIFSNLISNAIKFTKPDGKLGVAIERLGDEVRFAVSDDGPGIEPSELPHLFQKYWQKRPSNGGVGLGLYIAKTLVEAHGGRIGVESRPGEGSTVFFTLKVAGATDGDPARAAAGILVVDDDESFRRELVEVLGGEGYQVAEAGDGRQAMNYLASHPPPALIFLDLMMPTMDGWEFVATLRSQQRLASIPIVAMSGLERSDVSAPLFGVSSYLRKPPRLEQLIDIAARHCAG